MFYTMFYQKLVTVQTKMFYTRPKTYLEGIL